jgi:hypothetical protein
MAVTCHRPAACGHRSPQPVDAPPLAAVNVNDFAGFAERDGLSLTERETRRRAPYRESTTGSAGQSSARTSCKASCISAAVVKRSTLAGAHAWKRKSARSSRPRVKRCGRRRGGNEPPMRSRRILRPAAGRPSCRKRSPLIRARGHRTPLGHLPGSSSDEQAMHHSVRRMPAPQARISPSHATALAVAADPVRPRISAAVCAFSLTSRITQRDAGTRMRAIRKAASAAARRPGPHRPTPPRPSPGLAI